MGSTVIRLATCLLMSACLLVGCGGDGGAVADPKASATAAPAPTQNAEGEDPDLRAQEVAAAIRDLALVDPGQDVRLDAASAAFGRLTTEQLRVALLDENPAVRQEALDALLGEPESAILERLELLRFAMTDPDESVRESAVAVLGGSGDPRVVTLLLRARGDESPVVRAEAREVLADLRDAS